MAKPFGPMWVRADVIELSPVQRGLTHAIEKIYHNTSVLEDPARDHSNNEQLDC